MKFRYKFIETLFNITSEPYRRHFKKEENWNLNTDELLQYPKSSIGNELGLFLKNNGFELLDKSEKHDVFHIITNYTTSVQDEISMQFYLFGNGKSSPYLWLVMIIGSLIYPEKIKNYWSAYHKGKDPLPFYNFDFKNNLNMDINAFKKSFNI